MTTLNVDFFPPDFFVIVYASFYSSPLSPHNVWIVSGMLKYSKDTVVVVGKKRQKTVMLNSG